MTSHAMAISTFFRADLDPRRLDMFKQSITSLLESGYPSAIHICDDGSETKNHLEFARSLSSPNLIIHERPQNGGYARIKNFGIHQILEGGNDFGFLADDDIRYKPSWWERYIEAAEKTQIGHICFANYNSTYSATKPGPVVTVNNFPVRFTEGLFQGHMMTFTRLIIENAGYIRVFPRKLGYEHVAWTIKLARKQLIPFPIDIVDSADFLSSLDNGQSITTRPHDWREQEQENHATMMDRMDVNEPYIA